MSTGREPLKFNSRRMPASAPRPDEPARAGRPGPTKAADPVPEAPAATVAVPAESVVAAPSRAGKPSRGMVATGAADPAVAAEVREQEQPGLDDPGSTDVDLSDAGHVGNRGGAPDEVDVSDSVVRPVSVYMPRSTYEALRDTAHNREMDYTSLVIEALNEHSSAVSPQFKTVGSVSGRTMPVRASRRRRGEGLEHIQLRLDGLQRQWLAARVAESGAPSRAAFVTAVLNRHLGVTVR